MNMNWKLDMKQVIIEARKKHETREAKTLINVTHLNPNEPRISMEDPLKTKQTTKKGQNSEIRETKERFDSLENILNKSITLIEYEPIHVDKIDDEICGKMLTAKDGLRLRTVAELNNPSSFKIKKYQEKLNAGVRKILNVGRSRTSDL